MPKNKRQRYQFNNKDLTVHKYNAEKDEYEFYCNYSDAKIHSQYNERTKFHKMAKYDANNS